MAIIRFLGFCIFIFALISLAVDGTKSLASEELFITSFGEFWRTMHSKSFDSFQVFTETYLFDLVREAAVDSLLSLPLWVLLGVLGVLLVWLGRKRTRTSVYIN